MSGPALSVTRGDTLTWTFTIAEDLDGWSPRWTLKARAAGWEDAGDDDAVLVAAVGSGLVLTPGAESSTIALTVAAADTAALERGVYVWDLQLARGAEVRTVEWDAEHTTIGTLTVRPDVTRATS